MFVWIVTLIIAGKLFFYLSVFVFFGFLCFFVCVCSVLFFFLFVVLVIKIVKLIFFRINDCDNLSHRDWGGGSHKK